MQVVIPQHWPVRAEQVQNLRHPHQVAGVGRIQPLRHMAQRGWA